MTAAPTLEQVHLDHDSLREVLPYADDLPADALVALSEHLEPVHYAFGELILRRGDPTREAYILVEGRARVLAPGPDGAAEHVARIGAGDVLGEGALLTGSPRSHDVRASDAVLALRLNLDGFEQVTAAHPALREVFERQARLRSIRNALARGPLGQLPDEDLAQVALATRQVSFAAHEVVIEAGAEGAPIYVVESGRLRVSLGDGERRRDLAFLRAGDYFGELSHLRRVPAGATVRTTTACRLLALDPMTFDDLLGEVPSFARLILARSQAYTRTPARTPLDFEEYTMGMVREAEGRAAAEASAQQAAAKRALDAPAEPAEPADRPVTPFAAFPHVWQIDEADCGIACLMMVCASFGERVDRRRIRRLVRTSSSGASLRSLAAAAKTLGLTAKVTRTSASRLGSMGLPAIAHVGGTHWVVVAEVEADRVAVADPAAGLRWQPRQEFEGEWSGYACSLAPTTKFPTADDQDEEGWIDGWVREALEPDRPRLKLLAGLALGAGVIAATAGLLIGFALDRALTHGWILELTALLLGLLAAERGLRYAQNRIALTLGVDLANRVYVRVATTLLRQPMRYFLERRRGDVLRRLDGVADLRDALTDRGLKAVNAVGLFLPATLALAILNHEAGIAALLVEGLLVALVWRRASHARAALRRGAADRRTDYERFKDDVTRGIEPVKAAEAEQETAVRLGFRFRVCDEASVAAAEAHGRRGLELELAGGAVVLAVALALAHTDGEAATAGHLFGVLGLALMTARPLIQLAGLTTGLGPLRAALERLSDVLTPTRQPAGHQTVKVPTLAGSLSAEGLVVRYDDSRAAVEGVDFDIPAGSRVGVVGRSGSGQTTLLRTMTALLEPARGTIRFDGVDGRWLDTTSLGRWIGVSTQNPAVFTASIAENICLGATRDSKRVERAAKLAELSALCEKLPLGYETVIGEGARQVSRDFAQRLGLARSLYDPPAILLLDNALTEVDPEAERRIFQNLADECEGTTVVTATHSRQVLETADQILVLEAGRLVERGSHDELHALRGLYAQLICGDDGDGAPSGAA